METLTSIHYPPSNYDEISMHHNMLFGDSLKDLKNLRSQLYSAAEYFELSYTNDDKKHIVVNTLKNYAIKALVNTVDHLGSVTYKVNDFIDEKAEEVSGTEFRVSCIEQRLRTCQEYIDQEGIAQQSSIINSPRYQKRYVVPACQTMNATNHRNPKYKGCGIDVDDWLQKQSAVRATTRETPSFRKGRSTSPAPRPSPLPGPACRKEHEKRSASPHRFPLGCSGSVASRSTTPKRSSRPTTPNPALERQRYHSESRKSASMRVQDEKKPKEKETEQYPSKSKRLLKALLSRRKSKKDDTLYTYLDEY